MWIFWTNFMSLPNFIPRPRPRRKQHKEKSLVLLWGEDLGWEKGKTLFETLKWSYFGKTYFWLLILLTVLGKSSHQNEWRLDEGLNWIRHSSFLVFPVSVGVSNCDQFGQENRPHWFLPVPEVSQSGGQPSPYFPKKNSPGSWGRPGAHRLVWVVGSGGQGGNLWQECSSPVYLSCT